jgi:hypothetical protein
MSNIYRIRTQLGVDKSIKLLLEQDFEQLEILSLKILSSEIYNRQCSDYGVIVGRISANNGFGLPNCKVSVFIPLSSEDETNPVISTLYPYKSLSDINEDGYRYNLLPYTKSYSAHVPTGSFPDREDALIDTNVIEVYDKYYKFTTQTNESGDYMLFGVPLGSQTIHVDVDLSDIGEFSLAPQDLIRLGIATEAQVAGTKFKSSSNLGSLPQILSFNRTINIDPFWGQAEVCSIGITRTDFDITEEANITITPTAIFMGSIFSDVDNLALKRNCKPKFAQGELCSLVAGPGEILAIRQTIFNDNQGKPVLEQFDLDSGGQVIDDNGTWLVDVPMNLDYVTTNEFGERVYSNDPKIGIPTRGKYRFKVKWNQSPALSENVKRGYFLVPNVREYGWFGAGTNPTDLLLQKKSYAFSLNWDDYADPQTAINCEDTFYHFSYNKVYTVSQLIDQYRRGTLANRIISIKNILDNTCDSENNKFPTNDASFRWDFIFLLFTFATYVFRPILIALVFVIHVLFLVILILKVLLPLLGAYFATLSVINFIQAGLSFPALGLILGFVGMGALWLALSIATFAIWAELLKLELKGINLPLLLYDQCEFCPCDDADNLKDEGQIESPNPPVGQLIPPPALPNVSGIQIINLEGGAFNTDKVSDNPNILNISKLESGYFTQYLPNPPRCFSKVPQGVSGRYTPTVACGLFNFNTEEDSKYFTTSLTLAERINLFNTKAKYFDESVTNPGGGVNRIKVKVSPSLNTNPLTYHYDSVVCMLVTADSLQNLSAGTMISFVNPNNSLDVNYTGATLNVYGTNSITGSSLFDLINTSTPQPSTTQITVNYSDPSSNSGGNFATTYTIPKPSSADTNYHKFPTDVEYFQVITGMTYTQYTAQTSNVLSNNLNDRFLSNDMLINVIYNNNVSYQYLEYANPIEDFLDYQNQVVVFMVRGVDPYSTRVETQFGLGRLFGYTNEDQSGLVVTGNYKLNIPINGGYKNVSHYVQGNDAQAQDPYASMYLYHNSFNYVPSITQYSAFSSNLVTYYSSLNNGAENYYPSCSGDLNGGCGGDSGISDNTYGFRVSPSGVGSPGNQFLYEFNNLFPGTTLCVYVRTDNGLSGSQNRGYFFGEIVEGASYMTTVIELFNNPTFPIIVGGWQVSKYLSPKYPSSLSLNFTLGTNSPYNRQIVMRSDRLPTSDRQLDNCLNSFSLQQNQNLAIYVIPDDGALSVPANTGGISIGTQPSENDTPPPNFTAELLNSTNNCSDSVNLECYSFVPNGNLPNGQNPGGGDYVINTGACQEFLGKQIFNKGCYKLVTTVLLSIPKDIQLVTEWLSRTNITFGACRNVFSHLFTHNWINGGLYAFAFKNNRVFDVNNNPTSEFCGATLYLDNDTNNFYYRSSPYVTGGTGSFIGRNAPTSPNKRNLLFPTTIMDLGPRSDYLQELVFSDEYDGYVVKQLKSTSFQDVSELLNLLIITRLANTDFIGIMIGTGGASIFNYFTRVPLLNINQRLNVDADYAQMISINSELGVVPFEAEAYPNYPPPAPPAIEIDPVYFNTGSLGDTIFGIFYSSDTQVRDYITPKRTIINNQSQFNSQCAFNNFYCYSQEVPFYQWEIKSNGNAPVLDSIFGSQRNDWYSDVISGNTFHKFKYQSLDRGDQASRYFRTNTSTFTRDQKGYIYSIDTNAITPFITTPVLNPLVGSQDFNNPKPKVITVGAPFYFYFGLKKGKSAWDRFAKKWINFENITQ